jgi:hypothetical protein
MNRVEIAVRDQGTVFRAQSHSIERCEVSGAIIKDWRLERKAQAELNRAALEHGGEIEEVNHSSEKDPHTGTGRGGSFGEWYQTVEVLDAIKFVFGAGGAAAFMKASKDVILQLLKNRSERSLTATFGQKHFSIKDIAVDQEKLEEIIRAMVEHDENPPPASDQLGHPGGME